MTERVVYLAQGPSGEAELLALVYCGDPSSNVWYGHVVLHPARSNAFVALLCQSPSLIDAPTKALLFQRYHYWMTARIHYKLCRSRRENDVYAEASCFTAAADRLARMIKWFKLSHHPDPILTNDVPETRLQEIYGTTEAKEESGYFPKPPGVDVCWEEE